MNLARTVVNALIGGRSAELFEARKAKPRYTVVFRGRQQEQPGSAVNLASPLKVGDAVQTVDELNRFWGDIGHIEKIETNANKMLYCVRWSDGIIGWHERSELEPYT